MVYGKQTEALLQGIVQRPVIPILLPRSLQTLNKVASLNQATILYVTIQSMG